MQSGGMLTDWKRLRAADEFPCPHCQKNLKAHIRQRKIFCPECGAETTRRAVLEATRGRWGWPDRLRSLTLLGGVFPVVIIIAIDQGHGAEVPMIGAAIYLVLTLMAWNEIRIAQMEWEVATIGTFSFLLFPLAITFVGPPVWFSALIWMVWVGLCVRITFRPR